MYRCPLYPKGIGIGKIFIDIFLGYLGGGYAFLLCPFYNLIVHIGKILYIGDLISDIFKISAQYIKYNKGSCIAYMEEIIDGGSTDIHSNFAGNHGNKFFLFPS